MLNLFDKFRETVFLNESNRIEEQIEELKKIREEMNDTYAIDRDIKLLEAGRQGERNILYELKNANVGMYVLHDITLRYEDLTAQIDFVIVTKAHVYLVECKNMIGNLTVNSNGEFKREYTLNGKQTKEAIFSPLTQAQRHKDVLKKIWLTKRSSVTTFFLENLFEKTYKPLVVLANSKSLLNIKYAPKEIKNSIIRLDQLIDYIKKDIDHFDKSSYSNKKDMLATANSFLENSVPGNDNFVEKYKDFHSKKPDDIHNDVSCDRAEIESRLKDYRKSKSAKMKVPAYYIFTNEELEKVLDLWPKNLDELKDAKILSNVKLKCHSQEIIEVIQNGGSE